MGPLACPPRHPCCVVAAEEDPDADPAIGNVTGSNAVNVFLGIGLSWLLGAAYQTANGNQFALPPSSSDALGFAVVIFVVMGVSCCCT